MLQNLFGFQAPATPIMEGIIDLHNYIFYFLVLIFVFVILIFFAILDDFYVKSFLNFSKKDLTDLFFRERVSVYFLSPVTHLPTLEMVWTILPSLVLMAIAVPSFTLLYAMDEVIDPALTLKAVGHQWYWSYEYSDAVFKEGRLFDSYMVPEADLALGQLRLLEVDEPIVLPINTHLRVVVTADDVLHSWRIPALGIKIDAVPGRLSQVSLFIRRPGVFYGQCSELCGVNHGFMPISLRAVANPEFVQWAVAS